MCSSRIAYVLIAFEGFIGLTDKWIPVPFDALTWMPEKNTFEINIPRKTMEQAPVISKSEWPDKFLARLEMRDHSHGLRKIYGYYNCEPYWIEPQRRYLLCAAVGKGRLHGYANPFRPDQPPEILRHRERQG
jgi:hypothetical protein